jgi:FlaG/FlaF family flagellin (archaellin)
MVYIICRTVKSEMNSRNITTITLVAVASILAATIAVSTFAGSAFAQPRVVGAPQSQGAAQQANDNGLAALNNVVVGVQAQVGVSGICVSALAETNCPG